MNLFLKLKEFLEDTFLETESLSIIWTQADCVVRPAGGAVSF